MTAPPPAPPRPPVRQRHRRLVLVLAVFGILLATGVVLLVRALDPPHEPTPFTAAESRVANEALLYATAETLGGDWNYDDIRLTSLSCRQPDGTPGRSFFLRRIETGVLKDLDASIETVRDLWTGWGLTPGDRRFDAARGLSDTNPDDGAGFYLLSGPGGTVLAGESACADHEGTDLDPPPGPADGTTPSPYSPPGTDSTG